MGNTISTKYINFEDMQYAIGNKEHIIINTLQEKDQACLIAGTLDMKNEEEILNTYLKSNRNVNISIYGMNSQDLTIHKKYEQLLALGFSNVFIYNGGLFEWLLLQDIYGKENFMTTKPERDILKYKGRQHFNIRFLA
uniref:Rhodanese domain-containing protein n=1 Tax=viral metagenome TaxID=1070528 RepID=A0A6C0IHX0_9ZZZZ